ncbi:putative phosphatidylinositol 3-kinase [Trypanosoma cruzi]|uniref:Putative phosphatidylinositol 3-kinase n=1 Tax=Trypanosoma cruzi TaxID=5693 RepID=A0A2V2V9W5_TRYCR|nr:putative phosphatidylinositol 3-kinase [Trypanosoma cruzi]
MATNEGNVVQALQEQKHYDAFHWVLPSSEFIAANDITDYFMIYLRAIGGWCMRRDAYNYEDEEKGGRGRETLEEEDGKINMDMDPIGETQKQNDCGGVETLFVTLQMLHMEQPVTPVLQSSHTRGDACIFDEWVIFPISVRDMPLDAVVRCCVYSRHGLVGCTSFIPLQQVEGSRQDHGVTKFTLKALQVHKKRKRRGGSCSRGIFTMVFCSRCRGWTKLSRGVLRRCGKCRSMRTAHGLPQGMHHQRSHCCFRKCAVASRSSYFLCR